VTYGVHPAVKGDEPLGREQMLDRAAAQAGAQQLPPRDHTVLRASNPRREAEWRP